MDVILYNTHLNKIGGIETFTLNFCKRLSKNVNLKLLFNSCISDDLLYSISQYCTIERLDPKKTYECDAFISATAWGEIPYDQIIAGKYIQMIHACYDYYIEGWNFKYNKHPKVTHHVAVGESVAKAFKKTTGEQVDSIIFNLLNSEQRSESKIPNKTLSLVTASRISREKGFGRMLLLCEKLKGIDYKWDVYGDTSTNYAKQILPKFEKYPNVIFHGKTDTPNEFISKADYLVQLSDSEGMPYSVLESLQMKTPVILTDFPSAHELIKDGKNGYILNMDMSNVSVENILNIPKLKEYKERSSEKDWMKLLNQPNESYAKSA